MGDAEKLVKIIDERVLKNIPQNIVYRTSMIVTSVTADYSKASVQIPGDTSEYTLLNKTGIVLTVGDSVIVESTGTNLNNGLIVHKFGSNTNEVEISNYRTVVEIGKASDATGDYAIAVGDAAQATAESAIAVGYGTNASGENAIASGYQAVASGDYSSSYGREANATNVKATAIGALTDATGDYATAVGDAAQATATDATALGHSATAAYSNSTALGNEATAIASNSVTLGNSSVTKLRCQVTTITGLSDMRDKKDMKTVPIGLDFIKALKPISFKWNMRGKKDKQDMEEFGFGAQDLQEAQKKTGVIVPNLVCEDDPNRLETSPATLTPILVKAIQEQQAMIEKLQIEVLKKESTNGK